MKKTAMHVNQTVKRPGFKILAFFDFRTIRAAGACRAGLSALPC
jgi:hypothetical protein